MGKHSPTRPSPTERGYGEHHRQVRKMFESQVRAGRATCSRCGEPIAADAEFDLDHTDNRLGYRGVSHRFCNRSAGGKNAAAVTHRRRKQLEAVDLTQYADDPERGVFWGPPSDRDGIPIRWSSVWFEWRSWPEFADRV